MNNQRYKFFLLLTILTVSIVSLSSCKTVQSSPKTVTVYVSQDQKFSEPILNDFEQKTGIKVVAVYGSKGEEKANLINQLIAEKGAPEADVFWATDPIGAEILKQKEVLEPYASKNAETIPDVFKDKEGYWTGFSARARVFVVNKKVKDKPDRFDAILDPEWRGKAVIANPLVGSSRYHMAAMFTIWNKLLARRMVIEMRRNKVVIAPDDLQSVDFVATGKYAFAIADSNNAVKRIRQGMPISIVYPDQKRNQVGCFVIPNTAMLIKGAHHPNEARALIDYLLSKETQQKLSLSDYAGIPLCKGAKTAPELKPISEIKAMKLNYAKVVKRMAEIKPLLKSWVLGSNPK